MRRLVVAAVAAGAALTAAGCDSGPPVSETRPITTFTRLEVEGDLDLDVHLFNRPDPGVRPTWTPRGEITWSSVGDEIVARVPLWRAVLFAVGFGAQCPCCRR